MSDAESLRGCELYFDCFSGVAGDMTLGALLDLGVPEDAVRAELAKLPVGDYRLTVERVRRGALVGTKIRVVQSLELRVESSGPRHPEHRHHHHHHHHNHQHDEHEHEHEHAHAALGAEALSSQLSTLNRSAPAAHAHRHYADIRPMLDLLSGEVRERAVDMFERIAVVEARLHGVSVEEVAFHEVGAVDSIVDIVGAAAALAWLGPSRVTSRPVALGGGFVDTAHGRLPVPAPATLELLAGCAVEAGGDAELTTPTGAAIVAASAVAFGPLPPMRVVGVGWGAGERELPDRPNLLRVVAGRPAAAAADELAVVEANIDDMNPELCEPLLEALFAAGAVDAWFTPIVMKKSRPALTVAALCPPAARDAVVQALLRESTTIGARFSTVARTVLPRRIVEVDTPFGRVPVKVAGQGDLANAAPEYEACRRLAATAGVPVKRVYAAALAAFFRR